MIFTFAGAELDTDRYEFRYSGTAVSLEPQVFGVLAHLIANSDRVVSKEELLDEVWGDRFVSESTLTSRIRDARRALGDDGQRQALIRTVRGRGYRFVAPVASRPSNKAAIVADPEKGSDAVVRARPPRTRYARSGRYSIAYQVLGDGPDELVFIPGFVSNIELQWDFEPMASFFRRLARRSRLVVFDKRGSGLSDRVRADAVPTLEERMDDVRAVMDAAEVDRATLFGISEGGPLAVLFAATYPQRVERLVLVNSYANRFRSDIPELAEATRDNWGTGGIFATLAPSWRDRDTIRFLARYERHSATPDTAAHLVRLCEFIDVRPILGSIRVPTVILHRRDDPIFPLAKGEELARGIPGASFVVLEGRDHLVYVDQEPVLDAVEEFVGRSVATLVDRDRVLMTMVFVEPAESVGVGGDLGPAEHRASDTPLGRFQAFAQRELRLFRGVEVATSGEGMLITFDGPARAVRCARSLSEGAAPFGLSLQLGVHTAEVELRGDKITGVGVHVAAGVAAAAAPGEVWVTRVVHDLVAGSGLTFAGRGTHSFTAGGGEWELYAAVR